MWIRLCVCMYIMKPYNNNIMPFPISYIHMCYTGETYGRGKIKYGKLNFGTIQFVDLYVDATMYVYTV